MATPSPGGQRAWAVEARETRSGDGEHKLAVIQPQGPLVEQHVPGEGGPRQPPIAHRKGKGSPLTTRDPQTPGAPVCPGPSALTACLRALRIWFLNGVTNCGGCPRLFLCQRKCFSF